MQTRIIFLSSIFSVTLLISFISRASTPNIFFEADSLYKAKSYFEAYKDYEKIFDREGIRTNPFILLKMADISEKFNDIPRSLYYLSLYTHNSPSVKYINKIEELAQLNSNYGYQKSEITNLINFIRSYYYIIIAFFISVGFIVLGVLLLKFRRRENFLKRHVALLFIYLTCLLILINFPFNIKYNIIKSPVTTLRTDPSGAAQVATTLKAGDKLQYLGKVDIWNRVLWERNTYYLNENDCWMIE